MVSFMLYSRKTDPYISRKTLWSSIAILLLTALLSSVTLAAEKGRIEIESFNLKRSAEGYRIDVEANITLNRTLKKALQKGVELFFVTRFLVMKPRWYWLDEEVARCKERIGLSYHALTRQYRLIHHTQLQSFTTLEAALQTLGNQSNLPVEEHTELDHDTEYVAILEMWLDVSRLSKPFQLEWFDTRDWNLSSKKKIWHVKFPLVSEVSHEIDH